ncbi:unnamed protein product, partial [Musa textilis]
CWVAHAVTILSSLSSLLSPSPLHVTSTLRHHHSLFLLSRPPSPPSPSPFSMAHSCCYPYLPSFVLSLLLYALFFSAFFVAHNYHSHCPPFPLITFSPPTS